MLKPVVPAQNTTIPPRFTTRQETGNVCSPGCSNTISTSRPLPVISQIAFPNRRASLSQLSYSDVPTAGIAPQQRKSLRLISPLAPRDSTNSRFDSSEITPMALAPETAQSCVAKEPRPPLEPQIRTLCPGLSTCGR